MQEPESEWEPEFMQVQEQNRREPERRRMPNWLQNLIEVMLYHELYKEEVIIAGLATEFTNYRFCAMIKMM